MSTHVLDFDTPGPYRYELTRLNDGWSATARYKVAGDQRFAVAVGRWLWLAVFRARRKAAKNA